MKQTVVTVASPSGGVGKSTISKELAVAFSLTKISGSNIKTCLVEVNLEFGSQIFFFDVAPKYSIMDWVEDYRTRRETMSAEELSEYYGKWNNIEKYLTYIPFMSLYLLPAPSDGMEHEISFDELSSILYYLKFFFDALVIDTANDFSEVTIASIQLADVPLIVLNDEWRTIVAALRLRNYIRELEGELPEGRRSLLTRLQAVVNRYPVNEEDRIYPVEDLRRTSHMEVIAVLPNEPTTWASNNIQMPIVFKAKKKGFLSKDTSLRTALLQLAHRIVPEVDPDQFQQE